MGLLQKAAGAVKAVAKVAGGSVLKKVAGGLIRNIPIVGTIGGLAYDAYKGMKGSSPPALPPITGFTGGGVTGGGTGNVAYGGNIQAAAQARGMHLAHGAGRRYRRMNPLNFKALKRGIRRIASAEKLFRQVFHARHGGSAAQVRPKFKGKR